MWRRPFGRELPVIPEEKARVLSALKTLTAFVEAMEVSRSYESCLHWANGCKLGPGQMTPAHV